MKINQDGNMLGRITALAVIAYSLVSVGRLCGAPAQCPMSGGHCEMKASTPGK